MYIIRIICIFLLLTGFSNKDFNNTNAEFVKLLKDTKITVVAPASGTSTQWLSDLKQINSLKLDIPDHCFNGAKSTFHSHSDETRYKCLENALLNNSNNIIWALRGGYGSAKLISSLQKLPKPAKEKIFIGFSDMTALHIFLSQEWGWKTIHGNGIVEIFKPEKDRENFIKIAKIISGETTESVIKGLSAINPTAESGKSVSGSLTGGNLTIVQTSLGTNWQIKTSDKIIFLEDVDIKPYQLDRTLYHLKQAGGFNNINAIIFGACGNDGSDIMKVLRDFASHLAVPVFKSNRFGHEKFNDPIIYNTPSKIIPSNNGRFELIMKL
ncbi:MAG: LD-carboxypeptidase [Candidatus Rickettsia vulgarisii]